MTRYTRTGVPISFLVAVSLASFIISAATTFLAVWLLG